MDEPRVIRRRLALTLRNCAIVVLSAYIVGTIIGCSTEMQLDRVHPGMTEGEVRQIMGRPYGISGRPGEDRRYYWTWNNWFRPIGVLVIAFSSDGKVEYAFTE